MSLPMYFPAAPFDLSEVVVCAELVLTSYRMYDQWDAQGKPPAEDFQWTPEGPSLHYSAPIWSHEKVWWILRSAEPFAFVAWSDDGTVYLVFRGTSSVTDLIADLDADHEPYEPVPGYGSVHDGFSKVYMGMREAVLAALGAVPDPKRLLITGHSLGSGISTLAVPDIITHTAFKPGAMPVVHYNLASPRVGDPTFADAYNANNVPTYRIVNTCDSVPNLPPSVVRKLVYEHVGFTVNYTAQYGSVGDNHSSKSSYYYAVTHPDQPKGPTPS